MDRLGPNFNAINLKFLQIVGHEAVYNILKFQINSLKIEVGTIFFYSEFFLFREEFFCILDRLGLNFYAINLKFSYIVGHEAVYIM